MLRKSDTLIFIDGGDPAETHKAKQMMGYIDGQTTNPSLLAKNPKVAQRLKMGKKFTEEELLSEYKKIIIEIAKATDGPTSIEVHADNLTTAEDLIKQGREMATWIPNGYVKLPTTPEGLKAAQTLCRETKLNMTLCFTQDQAAAVYSATMGAIHPLYISPFVGRLDDRGENGMDLVANILSMYEGGDGHVQVLAASIRNKNHLLYSLMLKTQAITVPFSVFKIWVDSGYEIPTLSFVYNPQDLKEIPYQQIPLDRPFTEYNIKSSLTDAGLEKFAKDWNNLLL